MHSSVEWHDTDILILGSGGAGLFAALHAQKAAPDAKVTIAVKGLLSSWESHSRDLEMRMLTRL